MDDGATVRHKCRVAAPPDASGPSSRSPLRDETYRRLFTAQVRSLFGTGLTTVALALLAHDLAGGDAGVVLGTVLALKMIAYVLVAPSVGGMAHLLPRKALLVGLDLVRCAVVALLPFVDALWQVYALVLVLNVAAAGFTPTFQAAIPDVLPDEARYTRALSLSRLAYDIESLASPTLAALALAFVSYDALFVADSLTFVASGLLVASAAIPSLRKPERTRGTLASITYGLRGYLHTPRLRGLLALHLAASSAGAMVIVNTVVYVRSRLGLGDSETAWALAAVGGGSMVTAMAVPRVLGRVRDRRLMLAGGAVAAAALLAGALGTLSLAALLGLWLVIGLATSAVQTPAGRLVRRSCLPGDRAAFFSAEFALSHAAWLVAYPAAGVVGAVLGLEAAFLVLGALAVAGVMAAALLWPARDPEVLEHLHGEVAHEHLHVHDEHHDHVHEGWEGPEPHSHPHRHEPVRHAHPYVIDLHHPRWPG